ncbi:unnamed protein product [Cladocopium goreaui]|uniref:Uncharacterized protein n=1 Tax=Cladocopium goreaui TaxID=2562237 RepID=A0A9P1CI47_9DINO|nr:unnamed protein product [Cladocopium goreaui]
MVVLELLKYRVPAVIILLTLLIQWNQQIPHGIDRDFMEVFSGHGEISRAMRDVGMAGTSIDICLDAKAFDLTGPSAFGLVLNEVMRCKPGSTVVLAPDCRSLSKMCRHTSGRSYLTPMGNRGYVFVRVGNTLSGRTVIVALLAAWCGLRFIIEQPDGSFLEHLPHYQWLFSVLKVYAGTMYMGVFGSGSPKRHRLFSNCKYYLDTICDRAGYMSRAEQSLCSNKLVKKYIDKSGKVRCSGTKPALKESAHYPAAFGDFLASIALELRGVTWLNLSLETS